MKLVNGLMIVALVFGSLVNMSWCEMTGVLDHEEKTEAAAETQKNEIAMVMGKNLADWCFLYRTAMALFEKVDDAEYEAESNAAGDDVENDSVEGDSESTTVTPVFLKESDLIFSRSFAAQKLLSLIEYKIRSHYELLYRLGYQVEQPFEALNDNTEITLKKLDVVQDELATAIQAAIDNASVARIRDLIAAHPDCADKDLGNGMSPLLYAALSGYTNIAEALIAAGADVNAVRASDGVTPLIVASAKGHVSMVKLLLAHGADVSAYDAYGYFPLWYAFNQGNEELRTVLVAAGADINQKTKMGQTLLMRVCYAGDERDFRWLIDAGADVHAVSDGGTTALLTAVIGENPAIVRGLLAVQADPNQATTLGGTPLILATVKGNVELVQVLLDAGAHPLTADGHGFSALDYAGNVEIRSMLENAAIRVAVLSEQA